MKTFCYKCKTCGHTVQRTAIIEGQICYECGDKLVRDYKLESVAPARVPGGGRAHRG